MSIISIDKAYAIKETVGTSFSKPVNWSDV